ncbi:hypothetical protein EE612_001047 [Oryza sativa]|nr:hypothetical protein EE612_001047 [Oryza sativa]
MSRIQSQNQYQRVRFEPNRRNEKCAERPLGELQSEGLSCSNQPSWTLSDRLVQSLSDAPISSKNGGSMAVAPPTAKLTPRVTSSPRDRYGCSSGSPNACAEEIDDEAAVGAAAGGAVEVCHAVGVLADDAEGERAGHDEVAGVRQRVAEAEHRGVVLRPLPAAAAAAPGEPHE